MATTSNPKKCKDKNRRGEPCGAWAVEHSDYCFWHDPILARARAAARRRGGQARHGRHIGTTGAPVKPVVIEDVGDVVKLLERTIGDVLTLEKSIGRARAIGYLAGVTLRAFEVGDLEERITALEERLEARK